MKLCLEQLSAAALGAAYLTEEADGVHFHRFPPAQEEIYAHRGHPSDEGFRLYAERLYKIIKKETGQ